MKQEVEEFRDIPGYEGIYKVSNLGKVKSLKYYKERILNPTLGSGGYLRIALSRGKGKTFTVHSLVAMAFLDHIPNGSKIVIDHKNTIRTDNRLENLQLVSQRENLSKDKKDPGVFWSKRSCKWKSCICFNGKRMHLGYFINKEDAIKAYQSKLKEILQLIS